jgi:hypothetical protein
VSEPQIHSFETDCLPEDHPLAHLSVVCGHCATMVHAFNNECMTEWVEWQDAVLCLTCFSEFYLAGSKGGMAPERFKQWASHHEKVVDA